MRYLIESSLFVLLMMRVLAEVDHMGHERIAGAQERRVRAIGGASVPQRLGIKLRVVGYGGVVGGDGRDGLRRQSLGRRQELRSHRHLYASFRAHLIHRIPSNYCDIFVITSIVLSDAFTASN